MRYGRDTIFETSAKTGAGMEEWLAYLAEERVGRDAKLSVPQSLEAKTGDPLGSRKAFRKASSVTYQQLAAQ